MKDFKFKFDLDSKIAVYIPSTFNVNEPIDNSEMVKRAVKSMSIFFGGATASDAIGGWVDKNGKLVTEKVTIIYSYCTSDKLKEYFEAVLLMCKEIKESMKQEAITLEVNGQVKFI